MARQDSVASAAATSSENSPVTLSMTTSDIKAMEISSSGGLIIHKSDGSIVTVENFKALAEQGAKLTLQDGESIDAAKLFEALSADSPAMPAPSVATAASTTIEIAGVGSGGSVDYFEPNHQL